MERETGFEPATPCLEGRNSTTELLPLKAKCSQVFTTQLLEKFITSRPSGTSPKTIGIKCNPHSFRRGFAVHQVKSGLSNKVIQALGGWESPDMFSHYAASLTFDDALRLYKAVNSNG